MFLSATMDMLQEARGGGGAKSIHISALLYEMGSSVSSQLTPLGPFLAICNRYYTFTLISHVCDCRLLRRQMSEMLS